MSYIVHRDQENLSKSPHFPGIVFTNNAFFYLSNKTIFIGGLSREVSLYSDHIALFIWHIKRPSPIQDHHE